MGEIKRKDAAAQRRELTPEELATRLAEARAEAFNLRFRSATEAIENPMRFRALRRDIARMETELRQRAAKSR
ncbi:MAG TPA: 50S ribosomal protein L29 [Gemmatimonadales bacterium]